MKKTHCLPSGISETFSLTFKFPIVTRFLEGCETLYNGSEMFGGVK